MLTADIQVELDINLTTLFVQALTSILLDELDQI
ncbi:MAG: hypothetical protein ACJAXH_002975 [Colwellia sp.]|jgi:hypothetical protein